MIGLIEKKFVLLLPLTFVRMDVVQRPYQDCDG